MLSNDEWAALKNKIERDFVLRIKLAELAGRKINVKNYKAMEEFDHSIPELIYEIAMNHHNNLISAILLVKHHQNGR